ncbi:MAG TPA: phage virion morphogenesis protein [Nitrospiraceae bacterium]
MATAFFEAKWLPSPGIAARRLEMAALNAADLAVPAHEAKDIMQRAIERSFATETDPFGDPWAPWSESYEKSRGSKNGPLGDVILDRTGALKDYATSEAPWDVHTGPSEAEVMFDADGAPAYGQYHLTGTGKMPARVWLGFSDEEEAEIIAMFAAWGDSIIPGMTTTSASGFTATRTLSGKFL